MGIDEITRLLDWPDSCLPVMAGTASNVPRLTLKRRRNPMSIGRENDRTEDERIDEIKDRLQQSAGGQMVAAEFDGLDATDRREFWEQVLEFESAPLTTDFDR